MKWYHWVIAVLLLGCIWGLQSVRDGRNAINSMSSQLTALLSQDSFNAYQIRYWADEYGREHSTVQQLQVDNGLLADSIRSIAKLEGVKPKQVEGATDVQAITINDYQVHLHTGTDGNKYGSFTTGFKHVAYELEGDTLMVKDTGKIDIALRYYWRRPNKFLFWRYGRPEHYCDAYSTDDSMRRITVASMRIRPKQPGRFGAGPYVGIDVLGRPSVGMAINYSLIRF
ncbi:hypothetical protein UFOVP74_32 [uncultured Caudovirales phage]|uniref:Uncharacterized protein n=1 Tax=uncultured Caudovirales phage TaxID=2100421 RepID=A0A6J5KVE6_9CAUD|nr:hypothetical protein UFOVP74_32 [uncultured Caudovirales phage]